jgi:cell division protein FtsI (penicillin-binding protein 3)
MSARKKRQRKAMQAQKTREVKPAYSLRRHVITGLMFCTAAALIAGAWYQQVYRTDFLTQMGDQKHIGYVDIPARRGRIFDRNGEVLAVSTPVDSIWANPSRLKDDNEAIRSIAGILKLDQEEFFDRIARNSKRQFLYLDRWLEPQMARAIVEKIEARGIKGVGVIREYRRFYPAGEFFAHVIGFAGGDDKGQEGLELQYEDLLGAMNGRKLVLRDAKRHLLEDVESIKQPRAGQDLTLSLDRRLQFYAYRALKKAVRQHNAKAATLVTIDVQTGEVLAMVSQPSYNPNGSRSNKGGRLRNRAIVDSFEPGSTMKPITISTAMELGYITEKTTIDLSQGFIKVGNRKVTDPKKYGVIDPAGVLLKSSNAGSATIALKMPQEDYWQMLDKFGFGHEVGVGFPAEARGRLNHYSKWANIDHANLAFGYGISVSALQLAQAYSIIAADGIRRPVSMVKTTEPVQGERILSKQTAQKIRRMMEGVVTAEGTAPKAAVSGYRVAGKTGTVKKLGKHGYEDKKYRSLFAGMAPASNPRLVTVVVFDEPRGKEYYGGLVAGPVFSEVMEHALRLLNVKPDSKEAVEGLQMAAVAGAG